MRYEDFAPYFNYDPTTGIITNRVTRWNTAKEGDEAGSLNVNGYRYIGLNGKYWKAHRVAYLLGHGAIDADLQIDHINEIKNDNQLSNLRLATHGQNQQNQSKPKGESPWPLGVCYYKATKKFKAQIRVNGKQKNLGLFHAPELAGYAYLNAKEKYHTFGESFRC
tara:strand:- start:241 stop:735 length:495 start_codon:yes stop_codon:yes gene_type:complete